MRLQECQVESESAEHLMTRFPDVGERSLCHAGVSQN
jgi:hypothetical protein